MSHLVLSSGPSSIFWSFKNINPLKFTLSSSLALLHRLTPGRTITRTYSTKMSTDSSSNPKLIQIFNLPRQPGQAVEVTAAPGVSEIDFRCVLLRFDTFSFMCYFVRTFIVELTLNFVVSIKI